MKNKIFVNGLVCIILSACSISNAHETEIPVVPTVEAPAVELLVTKSVEAANIPEQTLVPTPTESLTPIVTKEPTPIQAEFSPFTAVVWANGVNLRTNPGYLFPALLLLEEGTTVQVLGRSPGDEWIYVLTPDQTYGWIYAQLLESQTDFTQAPLVEPGDVLIVKGEVALPDGTPVGGLQFAINRGTLRNDAVTDENGLFIAYMPLESIGIWHVTFVAISCDSIVMGEDCLCSGPYCGPTNPERTTITLPSDEVLQFVWE